MIGIYCIRNVFTDMCYVGQSVNLSKRRDQHFRPSHFFIEVIERHFTFEVLEICSKDLLDDRECHWIYALDSLSPNGYNKYDWFAGKQHCYFLSTSLSGKRKTADHKRKLSKSLKEKGIKPPTAIKGRKLSKETRKKMSEARKGKKLSKETREKMSKAKRGRKVSKETREKISRTKRENFRREREAQK